MYVLILGLILFIGVHAIRLFPAQRERLIALRGENTYKIIYTVISVIGLALIIWGKILAHPSVIVWEPPVWGRHLAYLLVPLALILLVAAYAPGHIRRWLRHPMLAAVMLWSLAHTLANGELASLILFVTFFVWSTIVFIASWFRETPPPIVKGWGGDLTAIILGFLAAMLILRFHMVLFGVAVV
ncbi:NnrU family protein [Maricaulis sp. D1M11]|uniref:NnrU family protein n=1 Tax=Maricaulis sp. D1M11 TaxID=3076117 RepID=UPI0039B626F4